MPEVGIVAALRLEVPDAVRGWRTDVFAQAGRTFQRFHAGKAVLVFSGVGLEPARGAAEALVSSLRPRMLVSLGFAGAASSELRIGDLFMPARVLSENGETLVVNAERAQGVLVTATRIAGPAAKRELRARFSADAVDMEAAAVARVAAAHGVGFLAVKAISDEPDCRLPPFERFAREDGSFDLASFAFFAALRPWLWTALARLSRNASVASATLAGWLSQYNEGSAMAAGKPEEMAHTRNCQSPPKSTR